jgi:hypothetical protein
MSHTTLKTNLHKAIDEIEDKSFLEAVYQIVKSKISDDEGFRLSPEQKNILKDREERYKKGESKSYSLEESKALIRKSRKK